MRKQNILSCISKNEFSLACIPERGYVIWLGSIMGQNIKLAGKAGIHTLLEIMTRT